MRAKRSYARSSTSTISPDPPAFHYRVGNCQGSREQLPRRRISLSSKNGERFAEEVGIDLFEVIDAIRMRPTHCNIRQPGFGVGGYCLTKDPLLAGIAARELFRREDIRFPFSERPPR